jgi:hypothetical protein
MENGGRLGDSGYLVQMAEEYAERENGKPVKKGEGMAKATKTEDGKYKYTQVTVFYKDGEKEVYEEEDFEDFFDIDEFAKGGETSNNIYKHKYIPTMTFEFTDYTSKGVKGIQKDSKSLSAKERKEAKIVTYTTSELNELFTKSNEFSKGGKLLTTRQRYTAELKGLSGLSQNALDDFIDENKLSDDEILNIVIGLGRKQIKTTDFVSAVVGSKDNVEYKKLMTFIKSDEALRA